ncbi:MAG: xanthine phosphoribosyltransferase [Clostridiaceae bacterium]
MKLLEDMILEKGTILPGNILKVDNFINHMIDSELYMEMGKEFYEVYKDKDITKILTLEVSGIAMAFAAAVFFKVPVLFAKKSVSMTLGSNVYRSSVYSYTKDKKFDIMVDKRFIEPGENILIIDDFLANGEALNGLIDLVDQAGANVAGIGIGIEKAFQPGGKLIRDRGYKIHSLARIEKFEDGGVIFCKD